MKNINISFISDHKIASIFTTKYYVSFIFDAFKNDDSYQINYKDCTQEYCDIVMFDSYNTYDNIKQFKTKIKGNPIYLYLHTNEFPHCADINYHIYNEHPKLYDYSISIYNDSDTNCFYCLALDYFYDIDNMYQQRANIKKVNNDLLFCGYCSASLDNEVKNNVLDCISNYKTVSCLGKLGHNVEEDFIEDIHSYSLNKFKFFLEIENTLTTFNPCYITEKMRDGYLTNSLSIYLGCTSVSKIFNVNSFIDINNCSNEEIIKRIKYVDDNDDIYLDMLHEYPFVSKYIKQEYNEKIKKFILNILNI